MLTYLIGFEQSQADLHPSPLAIWNLVQAPVQVDVQQADEPFSALGADPLNSRYHLASANIALQPDFPSQKFASQNERLHCSKASLQTDLKEQLPTGAL